MWRLKGNALTLQDLTRLVAGEQSNLSPFGRILHQWLYEPAQMQLLPDWGWVDGGCLILTEALRKWSHGLLQPSAWVFDHQGQVVVSHYAAKHRCSGSGDVFIDGDGLSTESEMLAKLNYESWGRKHRLAPDGANFFQEAVMGLRPAIEANLPGYEHISMTLAKKMAHEFGPFSEPVLSLDMLDEPNTTAKTLRLTIP